MKVLNGLAALGLIVVSLTFSPVIDLIYGILLAAIWLIKQMAAVGKSKEKAKAGEEGLQRTGCAIPLVYVLYGAAAAAIPTLLLKHDPHNEIGNFIVWIGVGLGAVAGLISFYILPHRKMAVPHFVRRFGLLLLAAAGAVAALHNHLVINALLSGEPILSTYAQILISTLQVPSGLVLFVWAVMIGSHQLAAPVYRRNRAEQPADHPLLLSLSIIAFVLAAYLPWRDMLIRMPFFNQPLLPRSLEWIGTGYYPNDTYPSIIQWDLKPGAQTYCDGWYSIYELNGGRQFVGACYNVAYSYIIHFDRTTREERILSTGLTSSFQSPLALTPDQQWIIYVSGVYGWGGLDAVRISDGKIINVTPAYLQDPQWLADGRLQAVHFADNHYELNGFILNYFAVPLPPEMLQSASDVTTGET